jgi:hypothetical protein
VATTAAIACGVGIVLLGPQVAAVLAGGRPVPAPVILAVLTFRPFFLLFAALAIVAAFWRTR